MKIVCNQCRFTTNNKLDLKRHQLKTHVLSLIDPISKKQGKVIEKNEKVTVNKSNDELKQDKTLQEIMFPETDCNAVQNVSIDINDNLKGSFLLKAIFCFSQTPSCRTMCLDRKISLFSLILAQFVLKELFLKLSKQYTE